MKDNLEICPCCGSNAMYHAEDNGYHLYLCYGCGKTSKSVNHKDNPLFKDYEGSLPELYRDLKHFDEITGLTFYPTSINIPGKGMVFADGTSKDDWKWAAVLSVKVKPEEQDKYPKQEYKADMKTIKTFDEKDFIESLDYINYFQA